jgi:hypothetical protein
MPKSHARNTKKAPTRVLALPDLEQAKSAVVNSLSSISGQCTHDHAITDFVGWYCSEPRLAFNRTVVLCHRIYVEQQRYGPRPVLGEGHGRRLDRRRGHCAGARVPRHQQGGPSVGRRHDAEGDLGTRQGRRHAGPHIDKLAPHDLRRTCARLCHQAGELDQIQFLLGHVSIQTTER